jgi:hypothetical protein
MPVFDRLIFFALDLEKIEFGRSSNSFENRISQVSNQEADAEADVLCAQSLASLVKAKPQPWLNENDDSENFEEAQWSFANLVELNRQFEQKFEPSLQAFFDYLISGRSFSGRRIAQNAGLYAYLTKDEIEEMTILLSRHYEEAFNLIDCGAFCKVDFESSMLDVMESMLLTLKQASGHDLFITAS